MAEPQPVLQPAPEPESEPWKAIAIGVALMAVVVGLVIWLGRKPKASPPTVTDPYAANLQFSDLHLQAAQNFAGGTVRYLDGSITNTGSRTVQHVTVQVIFRNSLGEVVDKALVPVRSLVSRGPYMDMEDLEARPLRPQETRPFRLVFEHISDDWNRGYPELQVVSVRFQ